MVIFGELSQSDTSQLSLGELFTNITNGHRTCDTTVNDLPGIVHNLKKGVRLLVIIISSLLVVYIIKYMYIIPEMIRGGILPTMTKYGVFSIVSIIINCVVTTITTYKYCNKYIEQMGTMIPKETILDNSVWESVPKLCGKHIKDIFLDIQNRCKRDLVTKIDCKLKDKLKIELEEKVGYSVKEWGLMNKKVFKVFVDKYNKFNKKGDRLNSIAGRIDKIKGWEKNTKILLETFEDKEGIQNSINKYLEKQLIRLDYDKLSAEYNVAYSELKTILKYIKHDPNPGLYQMCSICLINLKDSFLIPCGHTACGSCLKRSNINGKIICPHCRGESSKIGTIYI